MKKTFLNKVFASLIIVTVSVSGLSWAQGPKSEAAPANAKISLDLKGMDVVEVLKTLAAKGNLNLIIGSDIRGRVTMFLKEVDVQEAFEIILAANRLASERRGDILYVMTQKDYELLYGQKYGDKRQAQMIQLKYAKAVLVGELLNQLKTNIGKVLIDEGSNSVVIIDTPKAVSRAGEFIAKLDKPTETFVLELNYAKADIIKSKIEEVLTKGVGAIQIDERTNKIIVTDLKTNINKIKELVWAFDEKPMQVLIDAKIVEITPSKKFYSGIDWDYWIEKYFRVSGTLGFPLPADTGDGISLGTIGVADPSSPGEYKGIMDFLEIFGETKILSSPRIVALNNEEAKILVGTKDAYITSTVSQMGESAVTAQSVNFVDTGVKLYVTPAINKEGYITLKIRPEISSYETDEITVDGQKTDVPIVTTSQAETSVIVKDGVSILIGGLRKITHTKETKQVPILGSIPLLGFFFQGKKDEWEKDELVIVLTPHIVSGQKSIEDALRDEQDFMMESEVFAEFQLENLNKDYEKKMGKKEKKPAPIKQKPIVKAQPKKVVVPEKVPAKAPKEVKISPSVYYLEVLEKVKATAAKTVKKEKGKIKLRFTVAKDGKLSGEPIVLSTTANRKLKNAAKKIIKKSSPFPPFPDYKQKDKESFDIMLVF